MSYIFILSAALLLFGGMVLTPTSDENELIVGIGKSEFIANTRVEVRFVDVVEDSRCPEGVECIWAGNARIRIEISRDSESKVQYELETNGPNTAAVFDGLRISLKTLAPYPKADKAICTADYKATLTITDN
jgi:hypothetical protein